MPRTEERFAAVFASLAGCRIGPVKRLVAKTIEELNVSHLVSYDSFKDTITGDPGAIEAVWERMKTADKRRALAHPRVA
ncbi:MAG: hypothetical protein NUW23_02540 [Firmicutes bacterium]|jgi:hypothetical protein|nr:hypothetical protein [Bacillota bacterium]